MSRLLRSTVQYDGTGFFGFQKQPGKKTVQGALESAIARVTQQPTIVTGAGRTDAGVHALGQVVHFTTSCTRAASVLQKNINACLPEEVRIFELEDAPPGFHARFSAQSREYHYLVENTLIRSPLWRYRAHHIGQPLSLERMNACAQVLQGTHNFVAFGSPMSYTRPSFRKDEIVRVSGGTTRTVLYARCWRQNDFIRFCFIADAFLRHMVRMVVGTLLRVGLGNISSEVISTLLTDTTKSSAGPAAPAHGLYLVRVHY